MVKANYNKPKEQKAQLLEEALGTYISGFDTARPKMPHTFNNFFDNKLLVIRSIRRGIPYYLFEQIMNSTPFSLEDWAEYLNVSVKTLQRHKHDRNYYFKPIHSEKIFELAEVTQAGEEVFDSPEKFYLWLYAPSYALGNMTPAELLKDSYGKELVMSELNRIEHGIFA